MCAECLQEKTKQPASAAVGQDQARDGKGDRERDRKKRASRATTDSEANYASEH